MPALVAFAAFELFNSVERAPPAPATVAVGALGLALGGGAGVLALAAAGGGLFGLAAREESPVNDARLAAEVEGRICGRWRRRPEFATRTARFCPLWARQGQRWLARPPRLWISLPDHSEPPPPGSSVRARGGLTRFPGFANESARAPGPWRLRVKSMRLTAMTATPGPLARLSNDLRAAIDRRLVTTRGGERRGVALARGLLLGDDDELPEELRRALRRCGLAHLLAVSGFNLTLVAGLAALAAGAWARRRSLALPAMVVALYLAAVGQEPSLLRAALMAGAALALHGVGRAGAPLQALALAALGLIALDPALARDPGLQLSCGATCGLLLWAERWSEPFRTLPRFLALAIGASVAAQIGALPASVVAFGELAPLAPLINLIALPWAVVATVASLAWLIAALVVPPLAAAWTPALDLLAAPLSLLDRLPPSLWVSTPIEGGAAAGMALAAAGATFLEVLCSRKARGLAELALAVSLLLLAPAPALRSGIEVLFADVGQGDAALVRAGDTLVLIDGGGLVGRDVGTDVLRPLLVRRGWLKIDAALLSHPHHDHCAGLLELSRQVRIELLLVAPAALGDACVRELSERVGSVRPLVSGDLWRAGELTLEALRSGVGIGEAEANGGSLVVRLSAGGRSMLFVGDIGSEEERRLLLESPQRLASEVLKVAHHGSNGSSTPAFLAAVGARLAVISAGARNGFGHPAAATLARLAASGATVVRTDRDGEVVLSWRAGEPIRISLPASPRAEPATD